MAQCYVCNGLSEGAGIGSNLKYPLTNALCGGIVRYTRILIPYYLSRGICERFRRKNFNTGSAVNRKGYILCQKKKENIQRSSVYVEQPLNKKEHGKSFVQEIADGNIGIK
mgnify:FL=1